MKTIFTSSSEKLIDSKRLGTGSKIDKSLFASLRVICDVENSTCLFFEGNCLHIPDS